MALIENPERAKQLLRFDGVCYGDTIMPTDIDGLIEYKDRIWVLWEIKRRGKSVPKGQRLMLERFVKMARYAHKNAIAIVAEHDVADARQDVFLRDTLVKEYITTENIQWRRPTRRVTAKETADRYIAYYLKLSEQRRAGA